MRIEQMVAKYNEDNKENIALWGDEPFEGVSKALLRIRKAKILFSAEASGPLSWALTLWRARAIRSLCDSTGLNPVPLLLASLYWPFCDTTPEERAEQLRVFKHSLETSTVERIIENADVWGIESGDLMCKLFGLAQFGLATASEDSKFWVSIATEWPMPTEAPEESKDALLWTVHVPLDGTGVLREVVATGRAMIRNINVLINTLYGVVGMEEHLKYYRRFINEVENSDCTTVAERLREFSACFSFELKQVK